MIWQQLGYSRSPYFWEELGVDPEGHSLFVGRRSEGRRFIINAAEPHGATLIVDGRSGVGKTSFVNYNQYVLFQQMEDAYPDLKFSKPHLLPCLRKIQLREGEPPESIYLKIISGAVFSIQSVCRQNGWAFPESLEKVRDYVSQVVTESQTDGFGISAFGFGGSVSRGRSASFSNMQYREITFLEILDQIAETVRLSFGLDGILVPLNNLDILSPTYLTSTLDYLRDSLFSRQYYWWVLLGPTGLMSTIRHSNPRLAGVVCGEPIELGPLTLDELEELIDTRIRLLWFDAKSPPAPPVPLRIVSFLYERSDGDIRFAFQVANDIVRRVFYDYPSISEIDEELAARQIVKITIDEMNRSNLTPQEAAIIQLIASRSSLLNVTANDLNGIVQDREAASALENLVQKRLLSRSATDAGTFIPRGYTALAHSLRLTDYRVLKFSLNE